MGVFSTIRNWFRKGGATLGMVNELTSITDDPRISISSDEYERIAVAEQYYRDDLARLSTKTRTGPYRDWETDRKSTRLNSSHRSLSRMPSSA